jgi:hypothetical protein
MKTALVFASILVVATAVAQQNDESRPNGVIFGIAVDQNGQPAKGVGLIACPLGVALGTVLPGIRTNDRGEYRFENLPWWGRYTVYGEDEEAGYSSFSTGPSGISNPPEVEITPEHREVELNVYLPPKAGFLHIHLTNRRTGNAITGMSVALMSTTNPRSPLFTMSCSSNHVILLPSNKDLLLHVTSDGFGEWKESVGNGKLVHLAPGTELTLSVRLEPTD